MKSLPTDLANDIADERVTWAPCLRVWLANGDDLAFTSLDEDIVVDGVTYTAAQGVDAGDIVSTATLEIDNLELQGLMVSPAITEADLRAGLWDDAKMMLSLVNAEFPAHGALIQRVGWIGEVTCESGHFKAEFRGLTQAYTTSIGETTSATCRATLGDTRCGVDLGPLTVTGEVDSIATDNVTIHDGLRTEGPHPSGTAYFIGGKLTWTSGLNDGLSMEIRENTTGVLQLGLPMPYAVAPGDTYELTPGCKGHLPDCSGTYDNVVNFRGEPHLGGNDLLAQRGRSE